MRKISKLLVMAFVVLAVITLSVNVSASTNTLKEYVGGVHEINGMEFKLSTKKKETVLNYKSGLDDATSKAIYDDIISIENIIKESKVTKLADLSDADRSKAFNIAKSAAEKAGLTLTVNTKTQTFTLKKSDGKTLLTGKYMSLVTYKKTTDTKTTTSKKLLYTGANYAVYGVASLAVVAVAVAVIRKRK